MSIDLQTPDGFAALHPDTEGTEFGTCSNGVFRWAGLWSGQTWHDPARRAALLDWVREHPNAEIRTCSTAPLACWDFLRRYINGTDFEEMGRQERRAKEQAEAMLRARWG